MAWVHDQIYVAGGDHIPSTWASFVNQTGVTAVLHLCPVSPTPFRGPFPRSFLWMALTDENEVGLDERWLAASFIGKSLENGQRMLLHSSLRRHRVRWAYVSYLIWTGKSVRASVKVVEEKPWLAPYRTDKRAWEDFKQFVEIHRADENLSL